MATPRGLILDVDGTVVRGDRLIDGAATAIERLRRQGFELLFLSNNPTKPPEAYVERFGRHGIEVTPSSVLTAATVTAEWLAEEYPTADHLVIGSDGLCSVLDDYDVQTTADPDAADVVVASHDGSFDYDTLRSALWAYEDRSPPLIGTDPDVAIPTEDRPVPGSGAVLQAVAGVAETDPDVVAGKPSEIARAAALDRLGLPAEQCLVVGDRLRTDVALGADNGMQTALVLSGITDRSDLSTTSIEPDVVLDSIADLPDWLS